MSINMKFIALGSAGVVALAGAGVYAGTLTTTQAGQLGSGQVSVQASCVSDAVIHPGLASWDATHQRYEFTTLEVTRPAAAKFTACDGQYATANIFNTTGGAAEYTTAAKELAAGTGEADETTVTLTFPAGIDAGLATDTLKYGLVIQTHA